MVISFIFIILGLGHILIRIRPEIDILGWLKLCNARLVISDLKEIGVKYGSLYELKKIIIVIHITKISKIKTNK